MLVVTSLQWMSEFNLNSLACWDTVVVLSMMRLICYGISMAWYHYCQRTTGSAKTPPEKPYFIPYIGPILSFLWDIPSAIRYSTTSFGKSTISRVSFAPGVKIFLCQSPSVLHQVWKTQVVLDLRPVAVHFFEAVCGMSRKSTKLYLNDHTGNRADPIPGTHKPGQIRIHRLLYESDRIALTGSGLEPMAQSFMTKLCSVTEQYKSDDWMQFADLRNFVHHTVAVAELEALFGKVLLEQYPEFIDTFFQFEEVAPMLLKKLTFGRAERLRTKVQGIFRCWAKFASRNCTTTGFGSSDSDTTYWGSRWTKQRHTEFGDFMDDKAMASHDIGVTLAALGNTIPVVLMALVHTHQDPNLVKRARQEVDDICNSHGKPLAEIPYKEFATRPVLAAIVAETLRLYVTNFIPIIPQHEDMLLGDWRVPRGNLTLVSAGIAHHDTDVWNTQDGHHPVNEFWADRFIVDPAQPASGPARKQSSGGHHSGSMKSLDDPSTKSGQYFSLEGVKDSWVPFGGGRNACPGRFFAKHVIAFALAAFVRDFDLELLCESVPMTNDRFGVAVELPKYSIPFRLRKRTD